MFGYVKTDLPNMYVKDTVLYKALYCGLCKSIGKTCGQKGRFLLSYDLTFLSLLIHNVCDKDIKIKKEHCIIHAITKRPIAKVDDLSLAIGALNVILAYYKLNDDVLDNNKGRLKRSFFKRTYKKAKKQYPELDKIVFKCFNELLEYEKQNVSSIDIAADPFGNLLAETIKYLVGDIYNKNLEDLGYNLGKWIYLIDALDDFDKDLKKNNFNVLVNCYSDSKSKQELLNNHGKEIVEIFSDVLITIENLTKTIDYKFNHDLISNILVLGIKQQTKMIMENKKCKNTTKF